jgi:internalin A
LKPKRAILGKACLALTAAVLLAASQPAVSHAESQTAVSHAADKSPVSIPDTALEKSIRSSISKPTGDLTAADMNKVTSIYAYQEEGIQNLTGLEQAVNISRLVLDGNRIEDFSPLAALTKLKMLTLNGTGISDLTPLSGITGLKQLLATGNSIRDLAPLQNLKEITDLLLENNQITNLEPLAGMPITWLTLSGNQINDLAPLAKVPTLTNLYLANNQISDITPLLSLPELEHVDLSGNPLNGDAAEVIKKLRSEWVTVEGVPGELPRDAIRVLIDGRSVTFDKAPIIEDGTTLVPFRAVFEQLGLKVEWNAETQTVTGTKDKFTVSMQIGSTAAELNGKAVELALAPRIIDGTTFVPVRFVGEATGREVEWSQNIRTIFINPTLASDIQEVLFASALSYDGEEKDGLPHGKGKYLYNGTLWYEGSFVEGRMEGEGRLADLPEPYASYEGELMNNQPHGNGRMNYSDGTYYTGSYAAGKKQGSGKLYFEDGALNYEGKFEADEMSGAGTLWTEEGEKYVGSFQNSMMFGPFKQYMNDELVFEGEFQGSYREGSGKEFKNGKLVYEGEYMFDDRNGSGKLYEDGKLVYEGGFNNNLPHGSGTFYSLKDGTKEYTGEINQNDRTGLGIIYYTDGSYYDGDVYLGKANGQGSLYSKDGLVLKEGFFFQDEYQTDPVKTRQTPEYRILELRKAVTYYLVNGTDDDEDDLEAGESGLAIMIEDEASLKLYKSLNEKERTAFLNDFAQERWHEMQGAEQCYVLVGDIDPLEGILTTRGQSSDSLKLVLSPESLEDFDLE